MSYNREEILAIMPYGEGFCFLDEVIGIAKEGGQIIIKGYYIVKERDCADHFKGPVKIFPGVLKKEAISQLGVFWLRSQKDFSDYLALYDGPYEGTEGVAVLPGARLDLEFIATEFDGKRKGRARGTASIDGKIAHTLSFSFKIAKEVVLRKLKGS